MNYLIYNLKPIETKQGNYNWLDHQQEYKWDKDSPGKFRIALHSTTANIIVDIELKRV